jgi:putative FmdB family regulatory protein
MKIGFIQPEENDSSEAVLGYAATAAEEEDMPLFTYHCKTCNTHFERLCPDSREQVCCPQCGRAAKRVYQTSHFVLKGRGFHATDYGRYAARKTN